MENEALRQAILNGYGVRVSAGENPPEGCQGAVFKVELLDAETGVVVEQAHGDDLDATIQEACRDWRSHA